MCDNLRFEGENVCEEVIHRSYHVILAICKIYTLSVIVGLLISWAPFLLLRVHCCINFFLLKR